MRISLKILEEEPAKPYMDDMVVDGPKTDYRNEISSIPSVRKYMLEYL